MGGYSVFRKDRTVRRGSCPFVRKQCEYMKLCLGTGGEQAERLWVGIRGQTNVGVIIVGVFQLMKEASRLQNLFLMVDLTILISAGREALQSTSNQGFWECIDDNFLTETIEEAKRCFAGPDTYK